MLSVIAFSCQDAVERTGGFRPALEDLGAKRPSTVLSVRYRGANAASNPEGKANPLTVRFSRQ